MRMAEVAVTKPTAGTAPQTYLSLAAQEAVRWLPFCGQIEPSVDLVALTLAEHGPAPRTQGRP